jgi:hypothetical protein
MALNSSLEGADFGGGIAGVDKFVRKSEVDGHAMSGILPFSKMVPRCDNASSHVVESGRREGAVGDSLTQISILPKR